MRVRTVTFHKISQRNRRRELVLLNPWFSFPANRNKVQSRFTQGWFVLFSFKCTNAYLTFGWKVTSPLSVYMVRAEFIRTEVRSFSLINNWITSEKTAEKLRDGKFLLSLHSVITPPTVWQWKYLHVWSAKECNKFTLALCRSAVCPIDVVEEIPAQEKKKSSSWSWWS